MATDEELIKQFKRRSSQAIANQLITKYYREIYAYLYKQTMNKELSMDLTQEVFIRVLQSLTSYDEQKATFRTWLYKLATHRIIDYYRSKYYRFNTMVVPIDKDEIHHIHDFTIQLEYKQDVEKIIHIVNQMDAHTQQIFRLKLFAEYTFFEICTLLDLPESTVKTKYYSMIKKVKALFKEESHA